CRSIEHVAHRSCLCLVPGDRFREARIIRCAVMIDVVGPEHHAREFLKQVVLFVGRTVGPDHADRISAIRSLHVAEHFSDEFQCLVPGRGYQFAILANHRRRQALRAVGEVESVTAFHTEEVAIDTALVAIIPAQNFHAGIRTPYTQRREAAVAAVRADGPNVIHFPGPGLVSIRSAGQRADRADIDTHAALFALEMIAFVGSDHGTLSTVLNTEGPYVHTSAADTYAAIAQDAARPVEVDHRRPLLLVTMALDVDELGFCGAVLERHVLQFAFAARVANRAIQRMVREQEFQHTLARLHYLLGLGLYDHAFGNRRRTGRLHLRHLFDLDQTHAARALQRETRVVTERLNFNPNVLARIDQQRPRRSGNLLPIDRNVYQLRCVSHESFFPEPACSK